MAALGLVPDESVNVMLRAVLTGGHLEDVRGAQQRLPGVTVADRLKKNVNYIYTLSMFFHSYIFTQFTF